MYLANFLSQNSVTNFTDEPNFLNDAESRLQLEFGYERPRGAVLVRTSEPRANAGRVR
jgi:hypothetical protein